MGVEQSEERTSEPSETLKLLTETFPEGILETSSPRGDDTALARLDSLVKVMTFLKEDPRLSFNVLIDLTAVDYLGRNPRFEVIYHLLSLGKNRRLRVKIHLSEDNLSVDTVTDLWGSANWLEREVWDMFGIRFIGHPNLKRILLYEEFQGHPLRKDYPIRKRQPLIGPKT